VIRDGRVRSLDVEVGELSSPDPHRQDPRVERANVGLTLADVAPSSRRPISGPLVQQVEDGGVAATAGIEKGDVVRRVNQQTVSTAAEALRELRRTRMGSTVFVLIWRNGDERIIELPEE
jgi:S1-C subfamily serine protease